MKPSEEISNHRNFFSESYLEDYQDTEIGVLPSEWDIYNLDDYSAVITDYVANGSFASLKENVKYRNNEDHAILLRLVDYRNHFRGPFIYIDKHAHNFLSKTKLKQGDIIVANVGAKLGTVFRVPKFYKPMNLGPNAILLRAKKTQSNDFLFYWLKSRNGQQSIFSISTKTAQPKFNKTSLKKILIPVPQISEQRKIAEILSTVQNTIEKTEGVIEAIQSLKKSMMKYLFTYGPVPVNDAENIPLKENNTGLIPESWKSINFEKICSPRRETIEPKNAVNHIYIGLEHIIPGNLKIKHFGSPEDVKSTKNVFYPGDILYGKLRPYLNKVILSDKQGICSTDIIVLQRINEEYLTEFIANYLHTKTFLNFAVMTMTGVNHPRTSWNKFKKFKVPQPPIEEQVEMIKIFSSIASRLEAEIDKKKALQELFKALLNDLMTAKIRVNDLEV